MSCNTQYRKDTVTCGEMPDLAEGWDSSECPLSSPDLWVGVSLGTVSDCVSISNSLDSDFFPCP